MTTRGGGVTDPEIRRGRGDLARLYDMGILSRERTGRAFASREQP